MHNSFDTPHSDREPFEVEQRLWRKDPSYPDLVVVRAAISGDIRVIISAYRTEKISDDHPYI